MRLGMQPSSESPRSAFKAVIGSVVEGHQMVLALSNPSFNLTALMPAPFFGSSCRVWHRAAG